MLLVRILHIDLGQVCGFHIIPWRPISLNQIATV